MTRGLSADKNGLWLTGTMAVVAAGMCRGSLQTRDSRGSAGSSDFGKSKIHARDNNRDRYDSPMIAMTKTIPYPD